MRKKRRHNLTSERTKPKFHLPKENNQNCAYLAYVFLSVCEKTSIPPGKDRWRNSHVLVYHGPLQIAYLLGVAIAIYFPYGVLRPPQTPLAPFVKTPPAQRVQRVASDPTAGNFFRKCLQEIYIYTYMSPGDCKVLRVWTHIFLCIYIHIYTLMDVFLYTNIFLQTYMLIYIYILVYI